MRTRSPGFGLPLGPAELQLESAIQHGGELVLPGVDVQRHECARRIERLEAEARRAVSLHEVAVAQHVPGDLVLAFACWRDPGTQS